MMWMVIAAIAVFLAAVAFFVSGVLLILAAVNDVLEEFR